MYDFIHKKEQEKLHFELTRLLYVAATRSKKSLYLFANLKTDTKGEIKSPDKHSFLSLLWPNCHRDFLAAFMETTNHDQVYDTNNAIEPHYRRLKLALLDLKQVENKQYQLGDDNTPDLLLDDEVDPAVTGTVIHQILESISTLGNDWWLAFNETQKKRYITALFWGHQALCQPSEHNKICTAIENTLNDAHGSWILQSHKDHRSELSMHYNENDKTHTIIVDRTFIDEQDTRWIIDYKTTELDGLDQESCLEQAAKIHFHQLNHYKKVFQQIESRKIKLALYFPMLPALYIYPDLK